MKVGVSDSVYFDLLLFLKERNFFSESLLLIGREKRYSILAAALADKKYDVILSEPSPVIERTDFVSFAPFLMNSYRVFILPAFFQNIKKEDHILKIGVPDVSVFFRKLTYLLLNQHHSKTRKVEWVEYSGNESIFLVEQSKVDLVFVIEPDSFPLLDNKNCSILPFGLNRYSIPSLVFITRNELAESPDISVLKESLAGLSVFLFENGGMADFFSFLEQQSIVREFKHKEMFTLVLRHNISSSYGENDAFYPEIRTSQGDKADSGVEKRTRSPVNGAIDQLVNSIRSEKKCRKSFPNTDLELLREYVNGLLDELTYHRESNVTKSRYIDRLENELDNTNQNLSNLFMQLKDTSEKLIIKNIQAREAMSSKSRFFSSITHDLKTPLTGILSMTDFLLSEQLKEEEIKKLKIIQTSAGTLLTLINNILTNAKKEHAETTLSETIFSLSKVVEDVTDNIRPRVSAARLQFSISVDEKIPELLVGDPLKITQILYNILGNAVKFTKKGFISLSVDCGRLEPEFIQVLITIKDSGIGVQQSKLDEIFKPFRQENESISEQYGGTGLGLSIVKEYVDLMGGKIKVESKKGSGTTFYISLEFGRPSMREKTLSGKAAAYSAEVSDSAAGEELVYHFKPAKVLVLEDNVVNQEIVRTYFKKFMGLELVVVENGIEGLKALEKEPFDLVLSDILMPEMDGKDFCREVRAKKIGIPMVAITAYDDETEKNELKRLGFSVILEKPYDKLKIFHTLTRFLKVVSMEKGAPDLDLYDRLKETALSSKTLSKVQVMFLSDMKRRMSDFDMALGNRDKEKMKFFCHNLKGLAPSVGYPKFAELAEKISSLYKNDDWHGVSTLKAEMEEYVRAIADSVT